MLSGQAVARMDDAREVVMRPGDFFYVPPGHDSWVVGDEPYVSLHILGSAGYAAWPVVTAALSARFAASTSSRHA